MQSSHFFVISKLKVTNLLSVVIGKLTLMC